MKKPITILFVIALTLAACQSASQTSEVLETSEVSPPPLPTNTPQPTETPQPQIPPEVAAAQEFFAGKGFEVTPDGKVIDQANGAEIAGFTVIPFDENTMINRGRPSDPKPTWALQRVYLFEDQENFTVNMTEYDLKVEYGIIDMFGWVYENGEFTRQKVEFAAPNNGVVKLDGYSPEEVQYMIKNNSSTAPEHRVNNIQGRSKIASRFMGWRTEKINGDWKIVYSYNGMREIFPLSHGMWGSNVVPELVDKEWNEIVTSEYAIVAFKDRGKGLIAWYGENGKGHVYAVDGKWIDVPEYFNQYWKNHEWDDPLY